MRSPLDEPREDIAVRAPLRSALLLALIVFSAPGFGAEPRPPSVLAGVPALDKPVTYTETKIPLGELVQRVAQDTGAPLTASREVADEPVAVVVKDLPACELLEQLADLLDYRWSRRVGTDAARGDTTRGRPGTTGTTSPPHHLTTPPASTPQHPDHPPGGAPSTPRFEIGQDLASKQREEALRQGVLGEVEKQLRGELKRYVAIAALPPAEIQRILEGEQRHQEELDRLPPEQKARLLRSPEERERQRRHDAAQNLAAPLNRTLAGLLGGLAPQHWEKLQRERYLYFSTDPGYGELPLPAEIAGSFRASQPTMDLPGARYPIFDPAREERRRKQEKEGQELWAAATGYRVKLDLDDRAFKTRGMLILMANAMPLRGGVLDQAERFDFAGLPTGRLFLYAAPEDSSQHGLDSEAPPASELDKDPVLGAVKPFKPAVKPRPRLSGSGSIRLRLRDLLPDVARTYGVPLIADAYWSAPGLSAAQLSSGEAIALHTLLDRLAGSSHRWDRRGALLRLRSRTWFFDRPREVPLRLVQRWTRLHAERGGLPLEELLSMVTVLNEEQLNSLADLAAEGELPPDVGSPYFARQTLRLYAALSPAAREALWQGRALPVAQMTPAQRDLFLAAANNPNQYRSRPPDLREWAAGSVSLSVQRLVALQGEGSRFLVPVDAAGKPDPRTLQAMRHSVESGPVPTLQPGQNRPFLQLLFHLQYGPQERADCSIHVASP